MTRVTVYLIAFSILAPCCIAQVSSHALSAVGGAYLFRSNFGRTWIPLSSVQFRYSPPSKHWIRLDWGVEYFYLKHALPTGVSHTFFRAGTRQDFAFYPTVVILDFVHIGLGLYYTKRDEVVTRDFSYIVRRSGPMSFVRFFYQAALMYSLDITTSLAMPIGLSFRKQDYDPNTTPIALRAGVAVRF